MTWIDGSICLNDISDLPSGLCGDFSAEATDDTGCQCLVQSEWIADGIDSLTHGQIIR